MSPSSHFKDAGEYIDSTLQSITAGGPIGEQLVVALNTVGDDTTIHEARTGGPGEISRSSGGGGFCLLYCVVTHDDVEGTAYRSSGVDSGRSLGQQGITGMKRGG